LPSRSAEVSQTHSIKHHLSANVFIIYVQKMGHVRHLILMMALVTTTALGAHVITLTDDTFEHQTQASTGQTTGKWLVMFGAAWCGRTCNELVAKLEDLSEMLKRDEQEGLSGNANVLTARLDTLTSPETGKRFKIIAHPTLIYFADRKMYMYRGVRTLEAMKDFVVSGYRKAEGLPVPGTPTFFETQMKKVNKLLEENKHLAMLKEDFDHIVEIRKNAAVVLILMGVIVGFVLGCVAGGCGRRKIKEKIQ